MTYYIFSLNNNLNFPLIVSEINFLGCNIYKYLKISKNFFQINYKEEYFNIFCFDNFGIK